MKWIKNKTSGDTVTIRWCHDSRTSSEIDDCVDDAAPVGSDRPEKKREGDREKKEKNFLNFCAG